MILKTLFRWLWVVIAFAIAASIALTVLFGLGIFWLGDEIRAGSQGDEFIWHTAEVFAAFFFTAAVAPALTGLPALIAVIVGEVMRIRSAIYYTLAGGAALAVIPMLARSAASASEPFSGYMSLFAAAGFIGGFVYWALAGARA
ncbi:MAG: hypothetical protein ACE5FM_04585 [Methyloligellaceae bacterium]